MKQMRGAVMRCCLAVVLATTGVGVAGAGIATADGTPATAAAPTGSSSPQSWLDFSSLTSKLAQPATPDGTVSPMASGSAHSGCVNNYSTVTDTSISWTGNMVGCARGGLHLHTWLERNGALYINGTSNDCSGTSCTTASHTGYSGPTSGTWYTVVHGWNTTTGGDNYARLLVAVVP